MIAHPKQHASFALYRSICLTLTLLFASASGLFAQTARVVSETAIASTAPGSFSLSNGWLQAVGTTQSSRWKGLRVTDATTKRSVEIQEAFSFHMKDQTILRSSEMQMTRALTVVNLRSDANASKYSDRVSGKSVCAEFSDSKNEVRVAWCAILRDGSNYLRQQITIRANADPLPIVEVDLLRFHDGNAHVVGQVKGSPVISQSMFFGFEHPLSISKVVDGDATLSLPRALPAQPGQPIVYSSVIGVAPSGQMRRTFLRYVERERAHPYRPFLQYNSWYDLGKDERFSEKGALDRINAFGTELVQKRDAHISSFVFDDGWDDIHSLWGFDSGFPNGFTGASAAAARYHTHIGLWLSPWGGYNEPKIARVAFGRKQGYEIVNDGFALSGPKYYAWFEKTCLDMVEKYGANEFKFDGTGNADRVFPGSKFDSDFDAMLALIHHLRQAEPDIFINMTTGTYPSPFWLFNSDAIWRGGEDHDFAGVGTSRQRWITYRDGQVYKNVVQGGPLFPLNSLMLHGMIYAGLAKGLSTDPKKDFRDEVETFFGSGTQVQEMYVTPSLLSTDDWNALAHGAKWSLKNAETLKDTHWIGGDPAKLQVYGWAAWSPQKAIIVLRNPSDKPQTFSLDVQAALELPADAPKVYAATNPWVDGKVPHAIQLRAGTVQQIPLQPWEVRTFEAIPSR